MSASWNDLDENRTSIAFGLSGSRDVRNPYYDGADLHFFWRPEQGVGAGFGPVDDPHAVGTADDLDPRVVSIRIVPRSRVDQFLAQFDSRPSEQLAHDEVRRHLERTICDVRVMRLRTFGRFADQQRQEDQQAGRSLHGRMG